MAGSHVSCKRRMAQVARPAAASQCMAQDKHGSALLIDNAHTLGYQLVSTGSTIAIANGNGNPYANYCASPAVPLALAHLLRTCISNTSQDPRRPTTPLSPSSFPNPLDITPLADTQQTGTTITRRLPAGLRHLHRLGLLQVVAVIAPPSSAVSRANSTRKSSTISHLFQKELATPTKSTTTISSPHPSPYIHPRFYHAHAGVAVKILSCSLSIFCCAN